MTVTFWILAVSLAAAALAFVLPALLRGRHAASAERDAGNVAVYRDQLGELDADLGAGTLGRGQYDEARRELERRMLEDVNVPKATAQAVKSSRGAAIAVGIALPLAAALLYFAVGSPDALRPGTAAGDGPGVTMQQVESMVERLAARMQENPDDVKGWEMLGRSYAVLERYPEAVAAYVNAVKHSPPNAQLLADYADTLAMWQGRRLQGEPERLIEQALKIDPDNMKALALAGTAAFEKKDFKRAIAHWEKILKVLPPDSELAEAVRGSIADARVLAGGVKAAPAPKAAAPAQK